MLVIYIVCPMCGKEFKIERDILFADEALCRQLADAALSDASLHEEEFYNWMIQHIHSVQKEYGWLQVRYPSHIMMRHKVLYQQEIFIESVPVKGPDAPASNFFMEEIYFKGVKYHSAEQFYQLTKAEYFEDKAAANRIKFCKTSREAKKAACRKSDTWWDKHREEFQVYIFRQKYKQSAAFRNFVIQHPEITHPVGGPWAIIFPKAYYIFRSALGFETRAPRECPRDN